MSYIALTIGPIFKTLSKTKKTRELWGASYLFSYVIRNIVEKCEDDNSFTGTILSPSTDTLQLVKNLDNGAGIFPDRLIIKSNGNSDFELIKSFYQVTLKELSLIMAEAILRARDKENADKQSLANKCHEYLECYLNIYIVQPEISEGENPLLEISPYLDALELQQNVIANEGDNRLFQFFSAINHSRFVQMGFNTTDDGLRNHISLINDNGSPLKVFGFDSLPEIATRQFAFHEQDMDSYKTIISNFNSNIYQLEEQEAPSKQEEKEEDNLFEKLKAAYPDDVKAYHKYVAVVNADGDGISKLLQTIGDDEHKISEFSSALAKFTKNATDAIRTYGGSPVYAGGDDLLFFAPVVSGNDRNIFTLLRDLDQNFSNSFNAFNLDTPPTLTFGLSLTYYKYPMGEALTTTNFNLFENAKPFARKHKINALAFSLVKHSGAAFQTIIPMRGEVLKLLTDMIESSRKTDTAFLRSVIFKLKQLESLLTLVGRSEEQLNNFFKENWNEDIHLPEPVKQYFNSVKILIQHIYNNPVFENGTGEYEINTRHNTLYSLLRIVHFLNQDLKNE